MKALTIACWLLLSMPALLSAKDYNVLAFGAVPDGKTLNTAAIQAAVDQAHADGGGRVVLPAGRFLSGSIILRSGVEFHLEKNATLLGSTEPTHYQKMHDYSGVGYKALLIAYEQENMAVTGKGTLDGQGARLALNVDSLFYIGQIDSLSYEFKEKRPKWFLRPQVIQFTRCKNVKVTGVAVNHSACWVQSYVMCENVVIDDITIDSDTYWNNDGIDIVDCRKVSITNCVINSSDDGICLKSWESHGYKNPDFPYCDSIYIANCTIRSSASAVKLGTSSWGGFKNVVVKDIKVYDTFRSAIAVEMVTGGVLENIVVDGIRATNTGNAIFIRLGQQHRQPGTLKNVVIRNMKVEVPFGRMDERYEIRGPELPFFHNVFPSSITGIPGYPVKDVILENIEITYPGRGNPAFANLPLSRLHTVPEQINSYPEFSMFGELPAWGFYVRHVDGLVMRNIRLKINAADYRPAIVMDDVKGLKVEGLQVSGDDKPSDPIYIHEGGK